MGSKSRFDSIFRDYARYYDMLYSDKDYEKETDFLEVVFEEFCATKPKVILDAACGTGNHSMALAKRGYQITGVDESGSMIERARKKAKAAGLKIQFIVKDLRKLDLERKFDACVCMFAALGYITKNDELSQALSNIRKHLRTGDVFVSDFWYGPAVLAIRPSPREKVVEAEGLQVKRQVTPELDVLSHTCTSHYHLKAVRNGMIIDEIKESHTVRFFFPQEYAYYLSQNKFEMLRLSEFLHLSSAPSESTWNVVAIARAV